MSTENSNNNLSEYNSISERQNPKPQWSSQRGGKNVEEKTVGGKTTNAHTSNY